MHRKVAESLSRSLCVYLSIYLPIYLSTYLPTYLSIYLSIYLSTYQMAPHTPLWQGYFSTRQSHKTLEKHSVSQLFYLFVHFDLFSCFLSLSLPLFWLLLFCLFLFSDSSHLCCFICPYCRNVDFKTSFNKWIKNWEVESWGTPFSDKLLSEILISRWIESIYTIRWNDLLGIQESIIHAHSPTKSSTQFAFFWPSP